jgi:uncharacterized membrane protein
MTNTIGNPLTWGFRHLRAAGQGLGEAARHAGGDTAEQLPRVQPIELDDIRQALRLGVADFLAMRSDVITAVILYPIIGLCLIWATLHQQAFPLVFPLIAGFALIGPVASLGLYELSRRREAGQEPGWNAVFGVLRAPGFGAIVLLSLAMGALFALWLVVAWGVYSVTMGQGNYGSLTQFLTEVLTTRGGQMMILIGVPLGFVFALIALAVSIVSFPLLLDRDVGLPRAVVTSVRLFRNSPGTVLAWGALVVVGLVVGAIPFLLGLAITLPILGHATWHLYRRAVI